MPFRSKFNVVSLLVGVLLLILTGIFLFDGHLNSSAPVASDTLLVTLTKYGPLSEPERDKDPLVTTMQEVLKINGSTPEGEKKISAALQALQKSPQTYERNIVAFLAATCDPMEVKVCNEAHLLLVNAFTGSLADQKNAESRKIITDQVVAIDAQASEHDIHATTDELRSLVGQFDSFLAALHLRMELTPKALAN